MGVTENRKIKAFDGSFARKGHHVNMCTSAYCIKEINNIFTGV